MGAITNANCECIFQTFSGRMSRKTLSIFPQKIQQFFFIPQIYENIGQKATHPFCKWYIDACRPVANLLETGDLLVRLGGLVRAQGVVLLDDGQNLEN